jgi:hypothetical protein
MNVIYSIRPSIGATSSRPVSCTPTAGCPETRQSLHFAQRAEYGWGSRLFFAHVFPNSFSGEKFDGFLSKSTLGSPHPRQRIAGS